jgi:hypothetical protein
MPKLRIPGKPRGEGGGDRGAGRRVGSQTWRFAKHVIAASKKYETKPIEVLLEAMMFHFTAYREALENDDRKAAVQELRAATEAAAVTAPYVHPRLAAVMQKTENINPLQELLRHIDGRSRGLNGHTPQIEPQIQIEASVDD